MGAGDGPLAPAFARVAYELATLRLLPLFWPTPDRYVRLARGTDAALLFRARSVEHAGLVAHHALYAHTVGATFQPWRVALVPHLSGAIASTFSLEPADPDAPLATLAEDLLALGHGLAARVRTLARVRLLLLRGVEDESATAMLLSRRETEVLELFLAGLRTTSIAKRLFISVHTARNHIKHVCAKLGARSQRELREMFATSAA